MENDLVVVSKKALKEKLCSLYLANQVSGHGSNVLTEELDKATPVSGQAVAYMMIGLNDNAGKSYVIKNKPEEVEPTWWKVRPLIYGDTSPQSAIPEGYAITTSDIEALRVGLTESYRPQAMDTQNEVWGFNQGLDTFADALKRKLFMASSSAVGEMMSTPQTEVPDGGDTKLLQYINDAYSDCIAISEMQANRYNEDDYFDHQFACQYVAKKMKEAKQVAITKVMERGVAFLEPINPTNLLIEHWSSTPSTWDPRTPNGIKITYTPLNLVVTEESSRSQHANKQMALEKLKAMLVEMVKQQKE